MNVLNQDKPWLVMLYIGSAGFLLASYITIGFFLSRFLVIKLGAPEYWLAIGCLVGLIVGITNIVLLIKKFVGEDNG